MWKEQASQRVSCYPPGRTVGRRDRPRIGAVCPFVRVVSGVGDHITGDRPRPDPVWETARFSVTPAPTAVLRLCSPSGGCHDTPQRLFSSPSSTNASSRSEEHTSELQSLAYLVCRLLLDKNTNLLLH